MSAPGSIHEQLLDQARHLAKKEHKRPQQVSLRRAVSATYYSLFHFLIDEACRILLGTPWKDRALRAVLARAFDHGAMASASKSFQGGTLPDHLRPVLKGSPLPKDLIKVASAFVSLQEQRHWADYDLSR
jgi:hypothetical protein